MPVNHMLADGVIIAPPQGIEAPLLNGSEMERGTEQKGRRRYLDYFGGYFNILPSSGLPLYNS